MKHHYHAVVWIDHRQAIIYEFGTEGVNELHIKSPYHEGHIHHKAGTVGAGHAHDAKSYLTAISDALRANQEVLIVGDGGARTELAHFIRDHRPELATRVKGVEALDQSSKGQIVAFARKFFEQKDRSTPQL
jgi:stalled ribosome rescue protein Dom34